MNKIYYKTIDEKNLDCNFENEVIRILNDSKGWLKYGYKFINVNTNFDIIDVNTNFDIINVDNTNDDNTNVENTNDDNTIVDNPIIKIYLDDNALQKCGINLENLSCTRFINNLPDIIINYTNWVGGSKSKLSILDYHTYIINHEIGHCLGLDHTECPINECNKRNLEFCPASIMQQMSKGPTHIFPCIESIWPLNIDWNIDIPPNVIGGNKSHLNNQLVKKNYNCVKIIVLVIILILLIFIIIIYLSRVNISIYHKYLPIFHDLNQ